MNDIGDHTQTGDVTSRDSAGRDIVYGADPIALTRLLLDLSDRVERHRHEDRIERERRRNELDFHMRATEQRLAVIAAELQQTHQMVIAISVLLALTIIALIAVIVDRTLSNVAAGLLGSTLAVWARYGW